MNNDYDIAIVGMSCRFPGARNCVEFWRNLAGGVESIARLSDREILESGVPASYLADPSYVRAAPVLEQPGAFDARFFGFSPLEARTMDPQHRILLELAQEALEDAGCDPQRHGGRIGVFTGAAMNTYFTASRLDRRLAEDYIPTLIVNDKDFLSTRISYKLNLKGPSITVQTACSTSLVAVHLARQSLLSGETDMALAGAVSVRVPHRAGYFADAGGVSSPDGRVRAFDAKANGTVFGSGGGIVVLKRLADAIEAGDTIHAVIKGSAVNNDGAEKAGYTAPSVNSQADCVVEALANAGVDARDISYLEAHGSGTPLGDPIEIAALTKAFRTATERSGYCAVGSVKTNIGHLDAAAGIAGLIKTALALKHREIPATLHYAQPNPEIDFPSTPFYVNARHAPWASARPRLAGVMSTGMGGTNAHVILEEAPARTPSVETSLPNLLVLSATTASALDSATERLREFLKADVSANMDDVAFTLQTGRRNFAHRRYLVCSGRGDAVAGLAPDAKRIVSPQMNDTRRPLVLLLPGIGDQYVGMAHDLYCHFGVFRDEVDRCAQILQPHLGADIRNILYPASGAWKARSARPGVDLKKMLAGKISGADDVDSKALNQTIHVQPAQFTVEYALAKLWIDIGVVPDAIVGHSMGEYVAACLAGVMSLEDALWLIVRRAQLVDQLPAARMLAVALSEEDIAPLLTPGLSICLINGPKLCVVAGASGEVDELGKTLSAKGVICRSVENTHAFHSRLLNPVVAPFEAEVRKARLMEPKIPFVSNVTGTWVTKAQATDPAYWASHTNHTARFNDALRALWQLGGAPKLLEIGPGKTIGVLAMQHPDRKNAADTAVLSSLRHHYENRNDVEFLLQNLGGLWAAGVDIRWDKLHQGRPRRKLSLPSYPFERQEYWIQDNEAELKPSGTDDWFYVPAWERTPHATDAGRPMPESKASWLIFADAPAIAAGFRTQLQEAGAAVRVAQLGNARDYVSLFRELRAAQVASLNIVHLGCVGAGRNEDHGFFSVLQIAQAVGELAISVPIRLAIVSSGMHQVTGEEALEPRMATVLGPAGVIGKELPNVACFNVDLPVPQDAEKTDVVRRILAEFAQTQQGDILAYRGKYRWKRKYDRVQLPVCAELTGLRDRGVYLITGGTGGIGLAIARLLATACKARIVLTKKAAFPERARWPDLLKSKDAPDVVLRIIQQLLEIEAAGAEIEVFTAEAADEKQMRRVVDETLKRYGCINGVFHAAGIVRAGLMQAKTTEMANGVLSPKVAGTWLLHKLLADIDLDFLVLFSSITSVITPYAESDYAGANAFLDAFAHYSNTRRKYRTVSINWPGWREAGQLVDLQVQPGTERWKEEALARAIATRDGLDALKRILNSDLQQVVVAPQDLNHLIEESNRTADPAKQLLDMRAASAALSSTSMRLSEDDMPTNSIQARVADIWKDVFGYRQIGIHQEFAALGGHSLIAMQIVARVRSFYQIDFSLRDFFAAATIARLSAEVEARILGEIDALSDEEAGRLAQTIRADGIS